MIAICGLLNSWIRAWRFQSLLKASKGVLGITGKTGEKDKAEVTKKLYELGFEVGFKSHSEIGWVLREYNDLINKASKLGIKSPDSYYTDGKTRGKTSKDTGVDAHKTEQKADVFVKKVDASGIMAGFDDNIEEIETNTPQKKPSSIELPKFIRKGKASEIPGLLEGFKRKK